MLRRFRASGGFLIVIALLALSDKLNADSFGAAAPAVRVLQQIGGNLALWVDQTISPLLGQLAPSGGFGLSPALLLGGGIAIGLDLLRGRARRERVRRHRA